VGSRGVGHYRQTNRVLMCVVYQTVTQIELFYCADQKHALPTHEKQSAQVTVNLAKMHYTRQTVPTLSLD
jgi:hypothetical protein